MSVARTAYAALPKILARTLGPLLRPRPGAPPSAFLDPRNRTHGDAMLSYPAGYWDTVADTLGLRGRHAILDVGCGPGAWLPALARRNGRVVGVDVDDGLLADARARAAGIDSIEIGKMPAESLAFADATFDAVLCFSTLPYLDAPAALAEMRRVLTRDGSLVIGTVSSGYYAKHVIEGIRYDDLDAIRYGLDPLVVSAAAAAARGNRPVSSSVRAWSPRAARRLLERAGFRVESTNPYVDAIDSDWPQSVLGRPTYFVMSARPVDAP